MDWTLAIERNREALKRIVAALVAMAGMGGERPATLPRHLHRAVLRLLRPAESATRRLVIAVALTATPQARKTGNSTTPRAANSAIPRARKAKICPTVLRNGVGTGILMPSHLLPPRVTARAMSLPLFDRLRRPARRRPIASGVPRISAPGWSEPFPVAPRRAPSPDDPLDARRLGLRLQALGRALDDLPGQARRFARWQAFRVAAGAQDKNPVAAGAQDRNLAAAGAQTGNLAAARGGGQRARMRRVWPLRPGRPPGGLPSGSPRWSRHEVHEVLGETHWLAFRALERPDTS